MIDANNEHDIIENVLDDANIRIPVVVNRGHASFAAA